MLNQLITNTRLTLKYKEGSFSYSRIKGTASNEQLYELADAINSLQTEKPVEVYKRVTTKLSESA